MFLTRLFLYDHPDSSSLLLGDTNIVYLKQGIIICCVYLNCNVGPSPRDQACKLYTRQFSTGKATLQWIQDTLTDFKKRNSHAPILCFTLRLSAANARNYRRKSSSTTLLSSPHSSPSYVRDALLFVLLEWPHRTVAITAPGLGEKMSCFSHQRVACALDLYHAWGYGRANIELLPREHFSARFDWLLRASDYVTPSRCRVRWRNLPHACVSSAQYRSCMTLDNNLMG